VNWREHLAEVAFPKKPFLQLERTFEFFSMGNSDQDLLDIITGTPIPTTDDKINFLAPKDNINLFTDERKLVEDIAYQLPQKPFCLDQFQAKSRHVLVDSQNPFSPI